MWDAHLTGLVYDPEVGFVAAGIARLAVAVDCRIAVVHIACHRVRCLIAARNLGAWGLIAARSRGAWFLAAVHTREILRRPVARNRERAPVALLISVIVRLRPATCQTMANTARRIVWARALSELAVSAPAVLPLAVSRRRVSQLAAGTPVVSADNPLRKQPEERA